MRLQALPIDGGHVHNVFAGTPLANIALDHLHVDAFVEFEEGADYIVEIERVEK